MADRAKKIIRKAEKDLIQARIKAINSILDNISKQTELCRSSLVSIISTQRLRECQGFIDKVSEIRFNKVKQRQLNKFQNVVNKKKGNIIRVSNSPQAGNNLVARRQAGTDLPSGEGSNPHPRPLFTFLPGKEAVLPQATAPLPRERSSASQATAHLPREGSSVSQATAHLPSREGNSNSSQVTSQVGQVGNQARSGRQGFRHSSRHRAPHVSQENSTASQADSTHSWEGTPTPTIPNRLPHESSYEKPSPKWVINLSSKPLTPAQRSVLAKGPNFAVSPKQPPNLEYITAIEAACTELTQGDAEELRADVNRVLRSYHPPNPT